MSTAATVTIGKFPTAELVPGRHCHINCKSHLTPRSQAFSLATLTGMVFRTCSPRWHGKALTNQGMVLSSFLELDLKVDLLSSKTFFKPFGVSPNLFPAISLVNPSLSRIMISSLKKGGRNTHHQCSPMVCRSKDSPSSTRVCSRRLKEALMKNISRKVQLGLVAIVTATAMLVPSSLAAAQTKANPTIERWKICVTIKGVTICVGTGKVTPASVIND